MEPDVIGETPPIPLLTVALVAATVVHESVDEPPLKGSDAEFAESTHVGIESGITGAGGGGIGIGIGIGMDGSEQQGGATCANTCAGVMAPVTNAITTPKSTAASAVNNPMRNGFTFLCELIICSFIGVCTKRDGSSETATRARKLHRLRNFERSIASDPHTGHF